MKRLPVLIVQPVSRVDGQQLHFRALGQVRGFVHNQAAGQNASLDRHGVRLAPVRLPHKPLMALGAYVFSTAATAVVVRFWPGVVEIRSAGRGFPLRAELREEEIAFSNLSAEPWSCSIRIGFKLVGRANVLAVGPPLPQVGISRRSGERRVVGGGDDHSLRQCELPSQMAAV